MKVGTAFQPCRLQPALPLSLLKHACSAPCAQAMVEPVASIAFHPFNKAHAAEWRAVRARFARDADDIQLATRDLVDTCFRKLRSVDAAVQLLHSFQRIQVGQAINAKQERAGLRGRVGRVGGGGGDVQVLQEARWPLLSLPSLAPLAGPGCDAAADGGQAGRCVGAFHP